MMSTMKRMIPPEPDADDAPPNGARAQAIARVNRRRKALTKKAKKAPAY